VTGQGGTGLLEAQFIVARLDLGPPGRPPEVPALIGALQDGSLGRRRGRAPSGRTRSTRSFAAGGASIQRVRHGQGERRDLGVEVQRFDQTQAGRADVVQICRDGVERGRDQGFDLIVLDLTDPDTPAFHLYSEEFFRMCQGRLKPGGMLTLHLGSPVYQAETVRKNAANLRKVFKHVAPLSLFIPLYGSQWCLAVASDTVDPRTVTVDAIAQRMTERKLDDLRYYHPSMHPALFTLPRFVQDLVAAPTAGTPRVPHLRVA